MSAKGSVVKHGLLTFAAAVAVAFCVYAPSLRGGFVSDDLLYIEDNPLLRLPAAEALPRLADARLVGNWAPLHHEFLYGEWLLFGTDAAGYRIVNLLLLAGCSCALAAAARRAGLRAGAALLAGALLLLHPAAVEGVAWISQSKTLLALLFALLALERWLAYLVAPGTGRLAAAFALAGLSLLAKAAFVLLPGVFGVALFTHAPPGRRLRELPALACLGLFAVGVLILGVQAQQSQGGVVPWYGGSSAATARVMPGVLWRYLRYGLLPFDPVHGVDPKPPPRWGDAGVWAPAAAVLLAALAAGACAVRQRRLALAAAWWGAALLPVMQLVPMTTIFADRYLLVALPGLLVPVACGLECALDCAPARGRTAGLAVIGVALLALAVVSARQAALWADPERLYAAATVAYPEGRIGWIGLGAERQKRGDLAGAADAYRRALRAVGDDGHVWLLLARVRLSEGWLGAALYDLEQGARLAPGHPDAGWARQTAARLRAQGVEPEEDGR